MSTRCTVLPKKSTRERGTAGGEVMSAKVRVRWVPRSRGRIRTSLYEGETASL